MEMLWDFKKQEPVLLEPENLRFITGTAMKREVNMMYSVKTIKNYSYGHGFIELLNILTQNSGV